MKRTGRPETKRSGERNVCSNVGVSAKCEDLYIPCYHTTEGIYQILNNKVDKIVQSIDTDQTSHQQSQS